MEMLVKQEAELKGQVSCRITISSFSVNDFATVFNYNSLEGTDVAMKTQDIRKIVNLLSIEM